MFFAILLFLLCCNCHSTTKTNSSSFPLKENTQKVLEILYFYDNDNLTAQDIAKILNLEKRQVDGIFTSAFQRRNLGLRIQAEITLNDGSHQKVKFLKLTSTGLKFAEQVLA